LWWQQIVDQFQSLRRELAAKVPDGILVDVTEEAEQVLLVIRDARERNALLSLSACCEDDAEERILALSVETEDGAEELFRLVWHLTRGQEVDRHSRRNQGRGLNISADRREGPLSEGDAVALLRERLLAFLTVLTPRVRQRRALTVLGPGRVPSADNPSPRSN